MPTIMTHAVVGAALGAAAPARRRPALFWALSCGLAMLPDIDVVGVWMGVRSPSMWSHRGVTHSVAAAVAAGLVAGWFSARACAASRGRLAAYFALVMASHGLLDACTNGGSGVAFFAPFTAGRSFLPWRPIEVTPLGLAFFGARGLRVLASEARWVWLPALAFAVAAGWLTGRRRGPGAAERVARDDRVRRA